MLKFNRGIQVVANAAKGGKYEVRSSIYGGDVNFTGGPGMSSVSAYTGQGMIPISVLLGIVSEDEKSLQDIYKDIYLYDNICGTAADLKSTLTVSDFTLYGCQNDERIQVYRSNLERLGYPGVQARANLDYYTRGKYISTLIYNDETKMFTDQMIHSAKDVEIIDSPLYGQAPVIRYKAPEDVKKFFKDNSPHAQEIRKRLHPDFVNNLISSEVVLDPVATLYVPRAGISGTPSGQSMFRRIVPIYLLEKTLYRGTIAEAQKRQRSTLHIQAGSDNWQPMEEDLQMLVGLFQQAELDPVGSIVATRNDITTTEVRPGGDFWKYTDIADITTPMKIRILGLSESFLSGESTYNSMEVALSVFIENMRSDREHITRESLHRHILPLIAHVNGFTKRTLHKAVLSNFKLSYDLSDTSKLDVPKLHWHKSLRPEADRDYMEILSMLSDNNVPVPIAMMAAAGGVSIDELVKGFDEDLELRKKIAKHKQDADKILPKSEESRLSILSRFSGGDAELFDYTKTGKKRHVLNQRARRKKLDETIAKALSRLGSDDLTYSKRMQQAQKLRQLGKLIRSDGGIQ